MQGGVPKDAQLGGIMLERRGHGGSCLKDCSLTSGPQTKVGEQSEADGRLIARPGALLSRGTANGECFSFSQLGNHEDAPYFSSSKPQPVGESRRKEAR